MGITSLTETIQVLELGSGYKIQLGSGYKILTINTTFYDEFFSFFKQTAATDPTLSHGVKSNIHFPTLSISLTP